MTSLDTIFGSFLSKISDYSLSLLNRSENEIYEILLEFYDSAIAFFPQCRKNLVPQKNTNMLSEELTVLEIEIISGLMLLEYLRPVLYRNEVLEQVLSDKDFRVNSQANHMNQLYNLFNKTKQEVSVYKVQYSWEGNIYGK